ncbi:T9SS type A sorting domain-containing protein [Taibaiella lutea]|nr:T9SS type A sorting domain-containing protein [Taibaiella lutea]
MKRRLSILLMMIAFFGTNGVAWAQSTVNYAFSTNLTGSMAVDLNANPIDMSTGTTQLVASGVDAGASAVTNIGFDFFFMGSRYTQFGVQEDGIVQLGGTAPSTNTYTIAGGTSTAPRLSPFCGDMRTGTNGKIHYKLIGTAPNRVLVIEFQNMTLFYTSAAAAGTSTFQMRMYESTGKIQYVYGTMSATDVTTAGAGGNRAPHIGFYTGSASGAFASVLYATQTVSTTSPYAGNPSVTALGPLAGLNSNADGSRTQYIFTAPSVVAPSNLTFTSVAASAMTLNWTEPSPATGIVKYVVYNSTDGTNYNYVNTVNVGTNLLAVTGLVPGTNYFWKVFSVSEGALSATSLNGTQPTSAAATYYWVGTGGADFNTGTNWNTIADGSGAARTVADATDALIIDGDGTTSGTAATINISASASIGLLRITNSTVVNLQSSSSTTRTLTITGGAGNDLDITAGSSLIMNHATNAIAIVFTGTGNTGSISGTLTLGGGTGNKVTTTGGTGTLVTVQTGGTVNSTAASSTALLVGSTTTLNFAFGSNYNASGYTTSDTYIPTATWNNNSNITLSGGTTGTGVSNSSTPLGNVTINTTTLTANLGLFTSSTVTINGNLNIVASGTGNIRPVSSGVLTVLGNINLSGGTLQIAGAGSVKLAGNFNQTGGTLDANGTSNTLEFNGTAAQNATIGTMGTGALNVRINNAAGVNLTGNLLVNDGATLTISNGNVTGTGTVSYNATSGKLIYNGTAGTQTANAIEFPTTNGPASLTINNTATAPNNVVNIPFSRTLGTSGVLAMTAGILNNSGNTISVANTATGGVTGGSATAYVKGAVARSLPASLATGSTYLFPIGKGTYNQMELINPLTNAGGTVTISAEAIDAGSGGAAGTSISAINSNRYWAISATNGAANFTSGNMRLYDAPGSADAIAGSSTLTGAYGLVGGTTPVVTATSITTTNPGLTSLLGYYVFGTRAAATISNLAISPTGNQCTNVTRTVTATVTPGGAAISTVVINYSVNGTAQPAVSMTNTIGNNWSGTIPTVSPVNATVSWSITATDANGLTKTQTGTDYNDNPFLGANAILSASQTTVCTGNATTLSAVLASPGDASSIGAGTTLTGDNDDVTAFGNRWPTFHMQILYTAADLIAAGLSAGQISAITFKVNTIGSSASNTNYTVLMGATNATSLTGYVSTSGYTPVFPAANYTHAIGFNKITFTTPYNWDGASNVIVDLSYSGIDASTNAQTYYTTTVANTVVANHSTNAGTAYATRPNIIFTGQLPAPATAYSFSNGSTVVGTTNPLSVNVSSNTTYTATITASGCPFVTNPVTVNTIALPTAPAATNSSQCGAGIPTASVASTAGAAGSGTFYWYDAPTGGNKLQGEAYGPLSNYYTNDFSSATLSNSSITGNAAIASGSLALTPATTSQAGGLTVNASNVNSNQYQVDFDMTVTSTGTDVADGLSYSFSDDGSASSTSPGAEHGTGTKLKVSFDTYDAINGNNGKGIYVMYNATADGSSTNYTSTTPGVLAYVPDVSWIPTSATSQTSHVTVSINAAGQISLSLAGNPIFTNVQLPAAFINANKSTWSHIFKARSGGIAGGFALDNLIIKTNNIVPGYTTYQSSIPSATTFYVSELGTGGCESPRTPVSVSFTSNPLIASASNTSLTCVGGSTSLSVAQTGSSNTYSLTWTATPSAGSGIPTSVAGSLSTPVTVTPTVGGTYTYTITGVDGGCTTIDTVNVIVNDPLSVVTSMATATPSTICLGSATSLNMQVYIPTTTEGFETTFPVSTFSTSAVSGVASATQDITYFKSGAASMLFKTSSFNADVSLTMNANVDLSTSTGAVLTFSHIACLESYAAFSDKGIVEYSSDGGTNWTTFPASSYGGGATNLYNSQVGFSAFSYPDWITAFGAGSSSLPNNTLWKNELIYIPAAALTSQFKIRFRILSDGSVTYYGWLLDNVSIKATPNTQAYSWSDGSTTVGTTNPLVKNPTVNTNYTCSTTAMGCPLTSNVVPVTVNAVPTLAPTGTSGNNTQASGTSYLYTDGSCDLIAGITTSGNSLGAVTASVTIDPTVQTYNSAPYVQRHYTITPATNGPAMVTLYATQGEFDAYNTAAGASALHLPVTGSNSDPNIANVKVAKYATATPGTGGIMLTPTSVNWNAAKSWWEITVNTPGFSTFFIYAGGAIPLEIKLLDFTGVNEGKRNRLDWSTAKESIGDKFTVQRSTDGRNFSGIGTVAAIGKGAYTFYDENPASGMNQYRLLMTDTKGNQDFSKTVTLMVHTANDFVVEAYPNPAKDLVNIKVSGTQGSNAQLMLMDVSGRIIRQIKVAGNTATLDMHEVADGIYLLKYVDDSHSETIKMNKQ